MADVRVGGLDAPRRVHHGRLDAFPPYVGGDDDEIESWRASCVCGFRGTETESVTRAHMELIDHLNGALRNG